MAEAPAAIPKPQRWDVPFGAEMTDADVDRMLTIEPFSNIDPKAFGPAAPLREIIKNDCRIVQYKRGDIIVREGDYGSSLFFIMEGDVRVVVDPMAPELLGRGDPARKGWWRAAVGLFSRQTAAEYRDARSYALQRDRDWNHESAQQVQVFLQDIPSVLDEHRTVQLRAGAFFGEMAALARIPRSATVFADTDCELLEMRWQGFRDIRKRADELREHVDALYRDRSLKNHLHATPFFQHLDDASLNALADQVTFETLGEFDWFGSYKKLAERDPARRLAHEPIIAEEGHYPNGLIMIRTGFIRVSRKLGDGEQTISYLGRGQSYGFAEIAESYHTKAAVPLRHTIRAVGYVDIIRVPTRAIEELVLSRDLDRPDRYGPPAPPTSEADVIAAAVASPIDAAMLEFIVENRFMNGTATMLIDLDRCTGCDDCVRACAATHDGNPRFIRHGKQFGHHLVANACMHCADPVCMIGCPTGAIHRDQAGGEVVINDSTCIGCGTCANSCPYHNIRMVEIRDETAAVIRDEQTGAPILKATKCDLSVELPGAPPCQRACPHDALVRMDMSDASALAGYLKR